MSVTVDEKVLHADRLGLRTIGQVLRHLRRENRIVVNVLIDGKQPDRDRLVAVKKALVANHAVFIETADPRQMASEVLDEVESQLDEVDRLKDESAALLRRNQIAPAMERLGGCLSTWQHAQEAIEKIARLLRIDLCHVTVDGKTLSDLLDECASQLRRLRSAVDGRDFPALSDLLVNSMTSQCAQWRDAIKSLRGVILAP